MREDNEVLDFLIFRRETAKTKPNYRKTERECSIVWKTSLITVGKV